MRELLRSFKLANLSMVASDGMSLFAVRSSVSLFPRHASELLADYAACDVSDPERLRVVLQRVSEGQLPVGKTTEQERSTSNIYSSLNTVKGERRG